MRLYALVLTAVAVLAAACSQLSSTAVPEPPTSHHPNTLATPQPRLFVANLGNNTITVYDENGNPLKTSGGFPNVRGPQAITYDSLDQLLYVAMDDGSHPRSVSAYDTNGNLHCTFFILGGSGIAFDASNRHLYVTDFGNLPGSGSVRVYDQSGHLVSTSGKFAIDLNPTAIAFDSLNRELYVTIINGTGPPSGGDINVFDENGNKITPTGNDNGVTLSRPVGIAFDPVHQLFYIANNGLFSQIAVYDQNLNGIRNFPFLSFPNAIAFDSANSLIYTANGDNTMTAYKQIGTPVSTTGSFPNLSTPDALIVVP